MTCTDNEEQSGMLCYPKCKEGYYGNGPVCWTLCKGKNSADCGAFCAPTKQICDDKNAELIQAGLDLGALIIFGKNTTVPGQVWDDIFTDLKICD